MPAIMVMNPFSKKKKKSKQPAKKKLSKKTITAIVKHGGNKMAHKATAAKTIVRYKSPSKKAIAKAARSVAGKAKNRGKLAFAGLNIGEAAKGGIYAAIGVLAAQAAAKKFAPNGGVAENWTWKNYLLGPLGGLAVAFVVSSLTGGKTKAPQYILTGSFAYTLWKMFQSEVVQGNAKLEEYFGEEPQLLVDGVGFGAADELHPDYMGEDTVAIGDVWQGDDQSYVMGANGWYPVDESHRMGDDIAAVNPRMGDDIAAVNPRMGNDDSGMMGAETLGQQFRRRQGGMYAL